MGKGVGHRTAYPSRESIHQDRYPHYKTRTCKLKYTDPVKFLRLLRRLINQDDWHKRYGSNHKRWCGINLKEKMIDGSLLGVICVTCSAGASLDTTRLEVEFGPIRFPASAFDFRRRARTDPRRKAYDFISRFKEDAQRIGYDVDMLGCDEFFKQAKQLLTA